MKCPKCDEVYEDTNYFCPNCGAPNESITVQSVPVAVPVAAVPPSFESAAPPPKKNKWLWLIIVGAIALLGIIVVAAVLIFGLFKGGSLFGGGGKGDGILISMPTKADEADLYAVKLGKTLEKIEPVAEDAGSNAGYFYRLTDDHGFRMFGNWDYGFGGYIDNSNYLLLSYMDGEDNILNRTSMKAKEPEQLFDSGNSIFGISQDNGETIFINENRGDNQRCYVSVKGQEAEQVAKADRCAIAPMGSVIFTTDISSDLELTAKAYDLKGENEVVLMDDVANVRNTTFDWNVSGNFISYVVDEDGESKVVLVNSKDGEIRAESSTFYDIISWGFSFEGDAFYFTAENDEGLVDLYTLDAKGQTLITSGLSIAAQFDRSGKYLTYLVSDEEAQQTIIVHPLSGGKDTELLTGENLSMGVLLWRDAIVIQENNFEDAEVTVYSAKVDGTDFTEIYSDSDVTVNTIWYPTTADNMFLSVTNDNGTVDFFVTKLGSEDGEYLLEDWYMIDLRDINQQADKVVFSGKEDSSDDTSLFLLDLTGKESELELDDDDNESIFNAVFTNDGKDVVYTASTGSKYDDREIRQVGIDGKDDYVVLYEEAILVDVQWDELEVFDSVYFTYPSVSKSFCPGAPTLALETETNGELKKDFGESCYRFKAEADQEYTFMASGTDTQNLFLQLYDREGMYLSSDDDSGVGFNPLLHWTNGELSQTLFIKVTGYAAEDLKFTITAKEGSYDPALEPAKELKTDGSVKSGSIDSTDYLELATMGYFGDGDLYYFDGKSGQTVTIEVLVSTTSNLDPIVGLLSAAQYFYDSDYHGGTDNNAYLEYVLPEDGRYYIIVIDNYNRSGSGYTYTIKASTR